MTIAHDPLFLNYFPFVLRVFDKDVLCSSKALLKSFDWIRRERRLFNDKLMKVVSEEISSGSSPVTVENSKEAALRPVLSLSRIRLEDIEDDRDSILVVPSNDSFVRICSVGFHDSISPSRSLRFVNSCVGYFIPRQESNLFFNEIRIDYWVVQNVLPDLPVV